MRVDGCRAVGDEDQDFRKSWPRSVPRAEQRGSGGPQRRRDVRVAELYSQSVDGGDNIIPVAVSVQEEADMSVIAELEHADLREVRRNRERADDAASEAEHIDVPVVVTLVVHNNTRGLIQSQNYIRCAWTRWRNLYNTFNITIFHH